MTRDLVVGPNPRAVWVGDQLGLRVDGPPGVDGLSVHDLLGLALRRNPKRAHLLVSLVLGKHVPTDPRVVRAAGLRLGARVLDVLGSPDPLTLVTSSWRAALGRDRTAAARLLADVEGGLAAQAARPDALVVGYAETATGLGHTVADALRCHGLHSTRRAEREAQDYVGFEEEHSHATDHRLLPHDPDVLAALADPTAPLVLVDDELSTGRTVANTIRVLHARTPREHYVVAGLVDVRSPADRDRLEELAGELGTRIDVVSLVQGRVDLPPDVLERGAELVAGTRPAARFHRPDPDVVPVPVPWPAGVPTTGRFGTNPAQAQVLARTPMVDQLIAALPLDPVDVLVLGSEELLHAPLAIAVELAGRLPGTTVRFSSTTRSPVAAVSDPGYAVNGSLQFRSHDPALDGPGVRFAHNVGRSQHVDPWEAIVLVVDSASDPAELNAPDGVLGALYDCARALFLVTLPADVWRNPS